MDRGEWVPDRRPDREVYLYNRMPTRLDDPSYITELQYPVEKAANGR